MGLADPRREGTHVQTRSAFSSIVIGGLLVAASGLAVAAPPASAASPSSTTAVPTPAVAPPSPTAVAAPAAAAPAADALPPGQVWACVRNGQHVFSDKRCGPDASIRQLSALNTMSTPAAPPLPARMPPRAYYPDEGYAEDYGAEQNGDSAGVSGATIGYYGVLRRPAQHPRRPPPPRHVQPHAAPAARGSSVTRGH
jgi:hypothetical protein